MPIPIKLKTGLWPMPEKKSPKKLKQHLVVIGFGLNGRNVARAARMSGIPYMVIDMSPDTVKREREKGVPIFYGDAIHEEVLRHAGIEDATVVVVVINDSAATRAITENVRKLTRKAHVIVRTRYLMEMQPLYDIDAERRTGTPKYCGEKELDTHHGHSGKSQRHREIPPEPGSGRHLSSNQHYQWSQYKHKVNIDPEYGRMFFLIQIISNFIIIPVLQDHWQSGLLRGFL